MAVNDQGNLTGLLYFSDLTTFSKTHCYGNSPEFPSLKKHLLLANVFQGKGREKKKKRHLFSIFPGIKQHIWATTEYGLTCPDIVMIRHYLRFHTFT